LFVRLGVRVRAHRGAPRGRDEALEAMKHEEIDRFAGQRVRITRNDGSVFVGPLELDSVTYVILHGDDITRSLRYDDIRSVEAVDSTTPDTD
jgi:hypothetical protein